LFCPCESKYSTCYTFSFLGCTRGTKRLLTICRSRLVDRAMCLQWIQKRSSWTYQKTRLRMIPTPTMSSPPAPTDCTFCLDNEALYDVCRCNLDIERPSYLIVSAPRYIRGATGVDYSPTQTTTFKDQGSCGSRWSVFSHNSNEIH
jgi:hypothetical protein